MLQGRERERGRAGADPMRSQPRHAPALEPPQAARRPSAPPQSGAHGLIASQNIPQQKLCGPSPRHGARPWPVRVPSSRNLEAPDAHKRASTLLGRERGRAGADPMRSQPRHAPALEPPQAPGSPHIVCSGTTRTCKNRRPPPFPFWEGRRCIGRGGETPPPLSFSKRYAACPGPRPGSWSPVGALPARGSRTGAARLRTGGEEESARTGDSNPGCNYLVRGYSPSMHFFWGGDMPHYSPPLPFRRGLSGVPVSAGQPARAHGSGVADVRAGWRAQARAPGRHHVRACWLACPGPRPRTRLAATAPRFSPVCASPFSGVFSFLTDISV